MILKRIFAALFLVVAPGLAMSDEIAAPSGPIILTVTGDIAHTNGDGAAHFDMTMLTELPVTTFKTTTIWTEGEQQFTGVELHVLAEKLGVQGDNLVASAINDYHVEIPLSDAKDGGPILAYLRNGAEMSIRNKGPLWIVYPYDSDAAYRTETIYSRSIWQLDRIKVMK